MAEFLSNGYPITPDVLLYWVEDFLLTQFEGTTHYLEAELFLAWIEKSQVIKVII